MNLYNFTMKAKLDGLKKTTEGLRLWMVEINVEYDFILSSLANAEAGLYNNQENFFQAPISLYGENSELSWLC